MAEVLRGGSWNNNPRNVRASNRNRNEPTNRNNNTGVRCVGEGEIPGNRGDSRSRGLYGAFGSASPLPGHDPGEPVWRAQ